ncbi:hypothetical protein A6A25_33420 [Saccharothrix sp. CB00851]|nr:hypothetical protein A6A25_33420 [Saccharothrix sp. CB00851]
MRRESVQQGGEEGPVGGGEPWAGVSELALQDRDLVAQRQDLGVLARSLMGSRRSKANELDTPR